MKATTFVFCLLIALLGLKSAHGQDLEQDRKAQIASALTELKGTEEAKLRALKKLSEIGPGASSAVRAIGELLNDPSEKVRAATVVTLRSIGKKSIPILLEKLQSSKYHEKYYATLTFHSGGLQSAKTLPLLCKNLKHEKEDLVLATLKALSFQKSDEASLKALNNMLKNDSMKLKVGAADALLSHLAGNTEVINVLLHGLSDKSVAKKCASLLEYNSEPFIVRGIVQWILDPKKKGSFKAEYKILHEYFQYYLLDEEIEENEDDREKMTEESLLDVEKGRLLCEKALRSGVSYIQLRAIKIICILRKHAKKSESTLRPILEKKLTLNLRLKVIHALAKINASEEETVLALYGESRSTNPEIRTAALESLSILRKGFNYKGKSLVKWFEMLELKSSREEAKRAIVSFGPIVFQHVVESLVRNSSDEKLQGILREVLSRFTKSLRPELLALLAHRKLFVRHNVIKVLSKLGKELFPELLNMTKQNKGTRIAALSVLVSMKGQTGFWEELLPHFIGYLADNDESYREALCKAIDSLILEKMISMEKAAILLGKYLADKRVGVRLGVSEALLCLFSNTVEWKKSLDPLMKQILKGMKDLDPRVRMKCAEISPYLGPHKKQAVPLLAKLLNDSSEDVRDKANDALVELLVLAKPAIPALINALAKDKNEYLRARYAWTLTFLGGRGDLVIPAFIRGLDDPSVDVRQACAEGLLKFKGAAKSALPKLEARLLKSKGEERKVINDVIVKLRKMK